MRKIKFQTGQYYHIFNRGVDKRKVFLNIKNYTRFFASMKEFNNESSDNQRKVEKNRINAKLNKSEKSETEFRMNTKLGFGQSFLDMPKFVDIICYSLNPNHYHLLLKQLVDKGIERFMHKLNLGYTKYFNEANDRTGVLFQGAYQAVGVESDEQLLYLSSYINGNIEIHKITQAGNWQWSSYFDYLGKRDSELCDKKSILDQFKNIDEYRAYTKGVIREAAQRKQELKTPFLLE